MAREVQERLEVIAERSGDDISSPIMPEASCELSMSFPVWRVVSSKFATLREIVEAWSLDDLLDAHVILDLREAGQADRILKDLGAIV